MPIANKKLKARLKNFKSQLRAHGKKGNIILFLEERIDETKLQLRKNKGLNYDSPLLRRIRRRYS
jgi:hypothetical protein